MRDQFYGDSRDVLKWSILLGLAGSDKDILYVPMKRPNRGRHGENFFPVPGADPRVMRFFESERKCFLQQRKLERIKGLLPGRITLVPTIFYEHRDRLRYFEEVCEAIRSKEHQLVVFLDPDNGIAGKCPKGLHVCQSELAKIWGVLERGDSLVVYQHRFRDKEWIDKRMGFFKRVVFPASVRVKPKLPADVCFFVASARQTRGHGFSRAVQAR